MSNLSVLIFVTFLTALVTSLPNPESNGVRPGYCHHDGVYIKQGERAPAPVGRCVDLICRNADTNDLSAISCGLISKKPGCKIEGEVTTKPYPDCCAHNVCPDGSN